MFAICISLKEKSMAGPIVVIAGLIFMGFIFDRYLKHKESKNEKSNFNDNSN